jgi:uncharacterized protein involved in outer membrane biogenesis
MKIFSRVIIVLLGLILLLVIFRNPLIKLAVSTGVQAVVGMKLDIRKLDLNLGKSLIDIEEIVLYNPNDFPDPIMADVVKVYVDIDPKALFSGKLVIDDVQLDLREFVVVKNKDGEVNLDRLKVVDEAKESGDSKKPKPTTSGKSLDLNIHNLHLKIGKVVFKDYSKGEEPLVREFNLNLDERHQNIRNLNAVVGLIVFKVLTKTSIGQLTDINIGDLKNLVGGTLKGVIGGTTEIIGTTTDSLKNTTKGVGGALKSILGDQ